MIKFFRHIRLKLLSELRFSRYFIYAVGEIILVVIGILIALQINNWQTTAENNFLENRYYCQLLEDLDSDKNQLKHLSEQAQVSIGFGKQLIKELHTLSHSKDELLKTYINSVRSKTFISSDIAYTDLMSSGNLVLLSNETLKKKLIKYHQELEDLIRILKENNDLKVYRFTNWDSILEMGWQSPSISPGLDLDEQMINLLPDNKWHLDKNSPYFKKFQDVVFLAMTVSNREIEVYNIIVETMQPLYKELQQACNKEEL